MEIIIRQCHWCGKKIRRDARNEDGKPQFHCNEKCIEKHSEHDKDLPRFINSEEGYFVDNNYDLKDHEEIVCKNCGNTCYDNMSTYSEYAGYCGAKCWLEAQKNQGKEEAWQESETESAGFDTADEDRDAECERIMADARKQIDKEKSYAGRHNRVRFYFKFKKTEWIWTAIISVFFALTTGWSFNAIGVGIFLFASITALNILPETFDCYKKSIVSGKIKPLLPVVAALLGMVMYLIFTGCGFSYLSLAAIFSIAFVNFFCINIKTLFNWKGKDVIAENCITLLTILCSVAIIILSFVCFWPAVGAFRTVIIVLIICALLVKGSEIFYNYCVLNAGLSSILLVECILVLSMSIFLPKIQKAASEGKEKIAMEMEAKKQVNAEVKAQQKAEKDAQKAKEEARAAEVKNYKQEYKEVKKNYKKLYKPEWDVVLDQSFIISRIDTKTGDVTQTPYVTFKKDDSKTYSVVDEKQRTVKRYEESSSGVYEFKYFNNGTAVYSIDPESNLPKYLNLNEQARFDSEQADEVIGKTFTGIFESEKSTVTFKNDGTYELKVGEKIVTTGNYFADHDDNIVACRPEKEQLSYWFIYSDMNNDVTLIKKYIDKPYSLYWLKEKAIEGWKRN